MPDRRRVLIVGGGIAGLALAPMLARAGAAVEVIDLASGSGRAGTGIYLPGNAARALCALGLEGQVASRAVEIGRQRQPGDTATDDQHAPPVGHRALAQSATAQSATPGIS